jgi:hypothetical protein
MLELTITEQSVRQYSRGGFGTQDDSHSICLSFAPWECQDGGIDGSAGGVLVE